MNLWQTSDDDFDDLLDEMEEIDHYADDSTVLEHVRVVNTEGYLPPSSPHIATSHSLERNVQSSSTSGAFVETQRLT